MNAPTQFINSVRDHTGLYAGDFGPFRKASRLLAMGNHAISSRVPALLLSRGPSNIAGLVIAVVVWVSINGVSLGWCASNVSEERGEVFNPRLVEFYSSPHIVVKRIPVFVEAPILDSGPCPEFVGVFTPDAVPMFPRGVLPFAEIAPARNGPARPYFRPLDLLLGPAVAAASPHDSADFSAAHAEHRKPAKFLSSDVLSDLFHNAVIPTMRSSKVALETTKLREHRFSGYPPIQRTHSTPRVNRVNT